MALRDPDLASALIQYLTCCEGLVNFGKRMESRARYAAPPPGQRLATATPLMVMLMSCPLVQHETRRQVALMLVQH